MSGCESWRELLEDLLAIYTSGYTTHLEMLKAEVAAIFRYAESISIQEIDRTIRSRKIGDLLKRMLIEVRHERRADELL